MQSKSFIQPHRRLMLNTGGWVTKFRFLLPFLTEDIDQAFHEILYVMIESMRYRDKAMREIVTMVKNLEQTIDVWVTCKEEIVRTLKQLALEIYFQAEALHLYNEDGILMYTYSPHPDPHFEDVMLISVPQLTWNGALYEPRSY
jgi:lactam utilization protein B